MEKEEVHPKRTIRQRLTQFRTYYLVPVLAIVVGIIAAILILSRIFGRREENLLYVAFFDNVMDQAERERAEGEILDALTVGETQENYVVELDDSFSLSDGKDAERLLVLSSNHACDVLIGSRELLEAYAGYGYLEDLAQLMEEQTGRSGEAGEISQEEFSDFRNHLVMLAGYREDDTVSFDDTQTGQGEERYYAVDLSGSILLESLGGQSENVYGGIILECANRSNAFRFLEKLREGAEW